MFTVDPSIARRMAPRMQRALIVDPTPAAVQLLGELLRSIGRCQTWSAATAEKAMAIAKACDPQLIFIEYAAPGFDGIAFAKAIRRSDLACRKAPIIMCTAEATAASITGARDAGVHEFLRKPYTVKDLAKRLEAVTLRERDWVEAVAYIGPDRRRFNSGAYTGPLKRRSDQTPKNADAAKVLQALKIVRSAREALDTDWMQARRAMLAQAADLQKAAVAVGDMKLVEAAANLQRRLYDPAVKPPRPALEADIEALMTFMPPEEEARGRAA